MSCGLELEFALLLNLRTGKNDGGAGTSFRRYGMVLSGLFLCCLLSLHLKVKDWVFHNRAQAETMNSSHNVKLELFSVKSQGSEV